MRGKKVKLNRTDTRPNPGRKHGGLLKVYTGAMESGTDKPGGQEKPGTTPPTPPIERQIDG